MRKAELPTPEYLREALDYDPATGELTWKHRPRHHFPRGGYREWNTRLAGTPAFRARRGDRGYTGGLDGVTRQAHLVVFAMRHGRWPDRKVFWKNGNCADNRIENLVEDAPAERAVPGKRPPVEYLRQCFEYDEKTGTLIWKERPRHHFKTEAACGAWNATHSGKPAGGVTRRRGQSEGRRFIGLDYRRYFAHRIVWALNKGEWPDGPLDHAYNRPEHNHVENLRPASPGENSRNRGPQRNNRSGAKGVDWHRASGKWRARITVGGKHIYLGLFDDLEDAKWAYAAAALKYHGAFARWAA
jgi:hypothetical protein